MECHKHKVCMRKEKNGLRAERQGRATRANQAKSSEGRDSWRGEVMLDDGVLKTSKQREETVSLESEGGSGAVFDVSEPQEGTCSKNKETSRSRKSGAVARRGIFISWSRWAAAGRVPVFPVRTPSQKPRGRSCRWPSPRTSSRPPPAGRQERHAQWRGDGFSRAMLSLRYKMSHNSQRCHIYFTSLCCRCSWMAVRPVCFCSVVSLCQPKNCWKEH